MTWLNAELFDHYRASLGVTWGRPLRQFDSTSSTNDRALDEHTSTMKTGGVFVAREQTRGRGRSGAWLSPAGQNLTFSVLLRFATPTMRTRGYPLVVGLALIDALSPAIDASFVAPVTARKPQLRLKWPNDVYLDDKKLAGILVEARAQGNATTLVVGIGLNVLSTTFPEGLEHATSLALLLRRSHVEQPSSRTPELLCFEWLLAAILRELERRTSQFLTSGLGHALQEILALDMLLGRPLQIDGRQGIGAGIDQEGALLFTVDGTTERKDTGHVEISR